MIIIIIIIITIIIVISILVQKWPEYLSSCRIFDILNKAGIIIIIIIIIKITDY
jgi:hypothetical protein